MNELQRDLDTALSRVQPIWDEARTERTLADLPRKRVVRRVRRGAVAGALGLTITACWALFIGRGQPEQSMADAGALPGVLAEGQTSAPLVESPVAESRTMEFADGSRVQLIEQATNVRVERATPNELTLQMTSGRARFEVVPDATRTFRVACGHIVVEVLGTVFEVLREPSRTRVEVVEGRVAIRGVGAETELGPGQSRWFTTTDAPSLDTPSLDTSSVAAAKSPTAHDGLNEGGANDVGGNDVTLNERREPKLHASPSTTAAAGWREQAENGEFAKAYELIRSSPGQVGDTVQDLLLAADAARLSGHPADAVPYLRRVMEGHASDKRASLAAFTLGNVLMNQLGRPREAEAAYARARALSPDGALAQDAVARQVEAAHRAGDTARARTLALEYLKLYPNGRRVNAVRRFGGLE